MFGAFGKRVKSHCLCRRAASLGYNDQPDAAQRCRQHDVEEASQQSTQCQSPRKERLQLREMMRVFVQEAVNGKSLEAGDRGCEAELNPEGSLSLSEEEVDGATHDIPITDIKDVYGGTSVARLCAEAAPVRLDERCATLALRTAESASPSACPASESGTSSSSVSRFSCSRCTHERGPCLAPSFCSQYSASPFAVSNMQHARGARLCARCGPRRRSKHVRGRTPRCAPGHAQSSQPRAQDRSKYGASWIVRVLGRPSGQRRAAADR
ncbi:unnamed protein product [Prorocentrum cordatum]|uniref:Uncharacterized protein n=1 Tax=Prorocentrum cordatum TaxID=2364126 RepID=A0ABN9WEI7_9DINO|nr:unnamed protein product [Polarella glacialis]